ncbi:hypothetical protein CYMTET_35751 [Cymbomonas tetramitiformis]|uniref:PHD-type domain-containing protein n=1 Tax=Cymbomonas tetramitiformis TaxID=36881 RepID=A0AAE0KND7_9CHLO|nr:hypothetical protein CYMTET_35751 [Cymbomonas tetramitiformis]
MSIPENDAPAISLKDTRAYQWARDCADKATSVTQVGPAELRQYFTDLNTVEQVLALGTITGAPYEVAVRWQELGLTFRGELCRVSRKEPMGRRFGSPAAVTRHFLMIQYYDGQSQEEFLENPKRSFFLRRRTPEHMRREAQRHEREQRRCQQDQRRLEQEALEALQLEQQDGEEQREEQERRQRQVEQDQRRLEQEALEALQLEQQEWEQKEDQERRQRQVEQRQREQIELGMRQGMSMENAAEGGIGVPTAAGAPAATVVPAAGGVPVARQERAHRSCQRKKTEFHFEQLLCATPQVSVRAFSNQVARSGEEERLFTKAINVLGSTFPMIRANMRECDPRPCALYIPVMRANMRECPRPCALYIPVMRANMRECDPRPCALYIPMIRANMRETVENHNTALLLLGAEAVTVATYTVRPDMLCVHLFTTHDRRREQQFGGLLLAWLKRLASEKGLGYLLVGAISEPDVLSFWRRFGFTEVERHGQVLARYKCSMEAQTNRFQNTTLVAVAVQPDEGEVDSRVLKMQEAARLRSARGGRRGPYRRRAPPVRCHEGCESAEGSGSSQHADEFVEDGTACGVCHRTDDDENNDMLLCDGMGCDVALHLRCLDPPLSRLPDGDWHCPACEEEAREQHMRSSEALAAKSLATAQRLFGLESSKRNVERPSRLAIRNLEHQRKRARKHTSIEQSAGINLTEEVSEEEEFEPLQGSAQPVSTNTGCAVRGRLVDTSWPQGLNLGGMLGTSKQYPISIC